MPRRARSSGARLAWVMSAARRLATREVMPGERGKPGVDHPLPPGMAFEAARDLEGGGGLRLHAGPAARNASQQG